MTYHPYILIRIQWLEYVPTFMLDNALGPWQFVNKGLALGILLLGMPLFVECLGPWTLSITNQSEPLKSVLGPLRFGNAFGGVHYGKHKLPPHMVSLR
jgi:hypothetical protein